MQYGLIFDVDGVIADTEGANARATIKVFSDYLGFDGVKPEDFQKGIGRGAAEYVKAATAVHNIELTAQQVMTITQMRQEYFLQLLKDNPLDAFEGVLELMNKALESDDFCVGIATSSTREKSQAVLDSAKIPYKKMVYITGSDVKNKKPDPELFLKAASKMNVPPQRCVIIEDAPDGVKAAKNAQSKCIAVTNSVPKQQLTQADIICSTLTQINLKTIRNLLQTS